VIAIDPSFAEAAAEVVRLGRIFGLRGSVPATSGNFSVRAGPRGIAITRSGPDKGELTEADVLAADIDAPPPAGASAETALHLALYRVDPEVGAVVHTHADAAAILSRVHAADGAVELSGWELLKALRGVTTHEARVSIAVFPNDQDIPALAARVTAGLPAGAVAYLIAGHGLYAWGRTGAEAQRHAVALEHLLFCELERRKIRP
jgi:methylthioribulose-1-phosphate dehydratase